MPCKEGKVGKGKSVENCTKAEQWKQLSNMQLQINRFTEMIKCWGAQCAGAITFTIYSFYFFVAYFYLKVDFFGFSQKLKKEAKKSQPKNLSEVFAILWESSRNSATLINSMVVFFANLNSKQSYRFNSYKFRS